MVCPCVCMLWEWLQELLPQLPKCSSVFFVQTLIHTRTHAQVPEQYQVVVDKLSIFKVHPSGTSISLSPLTLSSPPSHLNPLLSSLSPFTLSSLPPPYPTSTHHLLHSLTYLPTYPPPTHTPSTLTYIHTTQPTHTHARAPMRGQAALDPDPTCNIQEFRTPPPNEVEGAGALTVWANTAWSTLGACLVNR
jgi:hypothetical protein